MELAFTVFGQVCMMFLLIACGFTAAKLKLVDKSGGKQITNILLYFVSPLVIIDAYQMKWRDDLVINLLIAFGLGIATHIIGGIISYLLVKKKNNENCAIERFAVMYSNCGYMALPLVSALFGAEGVFYASAYMLVFQLLSWTHGYLLMCGKTDKKALLQAFLSPVLISVFAGLLIFFLQIELPGVIKNTVSMMAALNTPLAMLVTGITLAGTKLKLVFTSARPYYIMLLSCLLVPLTAMAVYFFLPSSIPPMLILVNLISAACPCAVLTILFATRFELNEAYASNTLTLQNICCIVTIPFVVFLQQCLASLK